ncbi:glycosyltransferase family 2 protein [Bordetella sp. 02P26C-1]|uniref:glycosyltransferase family 2 protein n=1 Tax=Bordetella sp. 02P26C-1 TaxID=2683195 RepID=UPI0013532F62|nr:glycosyltransferase [Bordetella sp. 02P26C-1]MVW79900.1 glycosyltransferase [Bordetella sp. 02P26C-1]
MLADEAYATRVTIVVLTYNRKEDLCATLARLTRLRDGASLPYRIIVVDNASTDGTGERVHAEYPHVEVVRAPSNLGAAGRNMGVARVRTPYVAFCDDDTAWQGSSLSIAAHILDAHPVITVLNARIVVGEDARSDPACDIMAASPLRSFEGVGPELIGFMAGACVMRTEAFRKAGGYWPPFFIGGEEALLALDIMEQGGRIVFAPNVVTHHRPSRLRDARQRRSLTARNDIWTAWLRFPAGMALRRSFQVFAKCASWLDRLRLARDVLAGAWLVARYRQVLCQPVCRSVEEVWNEESAPTLRHTVYTR